MCTTVWFSILFCSPQWHCLDWVSEQHRQYRRHPEPAKRRRPEGCTAPLAQTRGNTSNEITSFAKQNKYEYVMMVALAHQKLWQSPNTLKFCSWVLCQGQIAEKLDEGALEALLSAIPEDLPSQDICPWFRTAIVPCVRRVLPRGQVRCSHGLPT